MNWLANIYTLWRRKQSHCYTATATERRRGQQCNDRPVRVFSGQKQTNNAGIQSSNCSKLVHCPKMQSCALTLFECCPTRQDPLDYIGPKYKSYTFTVNICIQHRGANQNAEFNHSMFTVFHHSAHQIHHRECQFCTESTHAPDNNKIKVRTNKAITLLDFLI